MFASLIKNYAAAVVKYRWLVLITTLLITVGLGSRIASLKLDNDPDLWSPQNHEFIKTTHTLEKVFGGRNVTVIGIVPKHGDIYTPAIMDKIRHIQAGIVAMPEAVKHNVVSLAAKRVKDIQGDADGMVVRNILPSGTPTAAELEGIRQAIGRNPIYENALVSPDGKAAAVIADFRIPPENAAYAPLYKKLQDIAERERDADTDILLGGQPIEAAHFEFAMQKMPMYFGLAFLIIMTVQLLAFRSLQGMLLPMVTAIISVLWGLGCMALAGIHMDALNTTTPILIMAVATGHAVQILKRYYEELDAVIISGLHLDKAGHANMGVANRLAVSRSLGNVGPVMLTAGLISAIVFFSMQLSDVAMIRHFGFFAGIGVLSALVIEFTFIPSLRAILPAMARKPRKPDFVDGLLANIGKLLTRPGASRVVLICSAVLITIAGLGASQLVVDNSVKQYTPGDSQIRKDSAVLDAKFGGTDSIAFLVEGQGVDSLKDPKVLAAMTKLQAFLEQQPNVGKTQSLADLIRRMNRSMHGDDKAYDVIPGDGNLVSQYLLLYSMSGQPDDFDNMVDSNYQRAVVWTYIKTDSTAYAEQLWRKCLPLIKREFPANVTVRLGGGLPQTMAINSSLVDTKVQSIGQMALVVFVLSSLVFASLVGGLLVVAPLAAIVLVNFGLMGWLGIPLDMGTATTMAMVTGIGADYEIYMLYRLREEFTRQGDLNAALRTSLLTSGKAVLFVALSIAGGYAALLIADFRFYPRLGWTMIVTMFISALLSLLLLRAIIAVFKPKFIIGSRNKTAGGLLAAEKA
ncbi:efflux RND transporter permease subunit [Andreprevotia chitinilytica]|uniref:efflux RND transporter permease subunit n=1 Tax=Andreprevotia chitinilytica TaxID=396808 RepID=UPI0014707961|nr:MMPL family transporter [Andreprevotia chitinilytica]